MTATQTEAPNADPTSSGLEAISDDTRREIVELREAGTTLHELRAKFPQLTSEQIRDLLPPANKREAKARAKEAKVTEPKAKAEKPTDPNALSSKQIAEALKTDPKTFRRYLRASGAGVGQGGRYEFTKADVAKHRKPFAAYEKEIEAKRAAKAAKTAADES